MPTDHRSGYSKYSDDELSRLRRSGYEGLKEAYAGGNTEGKLRYARQQTQLADKPWRKGDRDPRGPVGGTGPAGGTGR